MAENDKGLKRNELSQESGARIKGAADAAMTCTFGSGLHQLTHASRQRLKPPIRFEQASPHLVVIGLYLAQHLTL
jgi:hypothetical protein